MLAYSVQGSGPLVVFLHGISADKSRWFPVTDVLEDFQCVSVDLPGHGNSPDDGCDLISAASAVRDLVDHLDVGSPVVVGHSLGANVALLYGVVFGPRSCVAVDPAPLYLPDVAESLAPYREGLLGDDFEAAFHQWESEFSLDAVPEPQRTMLAKNRQPRAEVVLSYWRRLFDHTDVVAAQEQLAAALAAMTVPTLICLANSPSPEDARMLDSMTSATVEVYEGMGHYLHLVDPARFAARLRAWMQGLP